MYQTQQDPGHTIWVLSLQKQARCTHCLFCDISKIMQHRRGRGAHYGCTRPSLIPNKLMTPFPEATCGTTWCTLVRTRCLSTCCQSSKTCMMLMSTRCWMGPPAAVQPLFGVKQGCPLSPLLFSIYLNDIDSVTDGAQDALAHWYPWCEKHAVC